MKTHGTLLLSGSWWLLAADPNCLGRAKRWFPRADPRQVGQLRIRSSPEICCDLEAFLERYPLEIDPEHRAKLHAEAEHYRRQEESVEALFDGQYTLRDFDMAVKPRDYQRIAAELGITVRRFLLDDAPGVGKTISAISMLKGGNFFPALVVCPKQVARQWALEVLPTVLPGIRTHILTGTQPYDIVQRAAQQELFTVGRRLESKARTLPDVLVTTYERLSGWADTLAPTTGTPLVRAMVLDECVALRHRDTDKYRAAAYLSERMDAVIGLDGYPAANYGAEIGNILDVIRPGCLGSVEEFNREWCVTDDAERKKRIKDPRAFGLYLRREGLMLRRTAKDVGRELPDFTHVRVPLDGDKSKLDAIRGRAGELARVILAQGGDNLAKGRAFRDLDRIARQATGIAKAPAAADFIRGLVEQGERVLVGAWHREVHTILADQLKVYAPAFYTGDESDAQKAESLRRFKAKETPILVLSMSLKTVSGIDGLQKADCRIVVEVELDWAPATHDQFRKRLHREGQTHPDPVTVYTLVIDDGSDPLVADVICAKRANSSPVIDPNAALPDAAPEIERARLLAEAMRARLK